MNEIILASPYCEQKYVTQNLSLNYIRYYLIDNGYDAVEYDLANMDYDYRGSLKIPPFPSQTDTVRT